MRMGSEKALVYRVECGVQQLLDSRNVDFGVFYEGMIAVDENGSRAEQQEHDDLLCVGAI